MTGQYSVASRFLSCTLARCHTSLSEAKKQMAEDKKNGALAQILIKTNVNPVLVEFIFGSLEPFRISLDMIYGARGWKLKK